MNLLFTGLMEFLLTLFHRAVLTRAFVLGILLSFIALFTSALTAYVGAYSTIIEGINQTVPEVVSGVWGWVMPDNINVLIFSIFSAVLLRFSTKIALLILSMKFKAILTK